MSWLVPKPELAAGEEIIWRQPGSISLSRRWTGGTLYATTTRVIFMPGGLAFPRESPHEASLQDVVAVDIKDRDYTPYTGGMRKRLSLLLRDGGELLFVLKDLDRAVADWRKILADLRQQ